MTKRLLTRVLTALCVGMAVMVATMLLTACAVERDNISWSNPMGDKIYGTWYAGSPHQQVLPAPHGLLKVTSPT